MLIGAITAGYWIAAGGSVLVAIGIYSIVAVTFVLATSALAFLLSELGIDDRTRQTGSIAPAE